MKVLICGFHDLHDATPDVPVDKIGLRHLPFSIGDIHRADMVAVVGDGRALILKDRTGVPGNVMHLTEFARYFSDEVL